MPSSSSSSSAPGPDKITIVVGPVELTVLHTDSKGLIERLEHLADAFAMPVEQLVNSGCVRVFHGDPIALRVKGPSVSLPL